MKRLSIIGGVLIVALILGAGGLYIYQQSQETAFLAEAETAVQNEQFPEAIEAANNGLVIRPEFLQQHVDALLAARGEAHFGTGNWPAAIDDLDASNVTAGDSDLLFLRAQSHFALRDYGAALADINAITGELASGLDVTILRGQIYLAQGNQTAAYEAWQPLVDQNEPIEIARTRFVLAMRSGDANWIVESAEAVLALDEADIEATLALGQDALSRNETEAAIGRFSQVDTAETTAWLSVAQWLNGQVSEAQASGQAAVAHDSDNKLAQAMAATGSARITLLSESISLANDWAYPYLVYLRGAMLAEIGLLDGALSDAELLLAGPSQYWGYTLRGDVNRLRGAYPQAIFDFDQAIALYPEGSSALIGRAETYRLQDDLSAAFVDGTTAQNVQPTNARVLPILARIATDEGDSETAIGLWTEVVEANEQDLTAREARANLHFTAMDWTAAQDDYTIVLEAQPDNTVALQKRGEARLALGEIEAAIEDLSAALVLSPQDAQLYTLRAEALQASGDLEAAVRDARRAVQFDDEIPSPHLIIALFALEEERYFDAVLSFTEALELDDELAQGYAYRSEAYFFLNDTDRARADARQALELDDSLAQAHMAQAFIHAYDRDWLDAIDEANTAVDLAPDDVRVLLNRGIIYLDGGDYNEALDDFTLIIDLDPEYRLAYLLRAEAQIQLQRYEDALDTFNTIIAADQGVLSEYLDAVELSESRSVDLLRIPEAVEGKRTWEDTEHGFAITYPEEWLQFVDPGTEFPLFLSGPLDKDYRANLNLIVIDNINLTTSQLSRAFDPPSTLKDFEEIQNRSYLIGGRSGIRKTFTWTAVDDRLRDIPVTVIQVYMLSGRTAYLFSATMRTEDVEKYEPLFNEMLESFAFTQ